MYLKVVTIVCVAMLLTGCSSVTLQQEVLPQIDQVEESLREESVDKDLVTETDTIEVIKELPEKEETSKKVVSDTEPVYIQSETVKIVIKGEDGDFIYDVFTVAFEEVETGKQVRKFPTGNMLVFDGIKAGEYNLLVDPVIKGKEMYSEYKSQSIPIAIGGEGGLNVRTVNVQVEKKEVSETLNTPVVTPILKSETVQIIIKDLEGNEILDSFTVAFEEVETGKQVRKFPTGNRLVFHHVPAGEYNLLVGAITKTGDLKAEYKSQSVPITIGGQGSSEMRTVNILAEKRVD